MNKCEYCGRENDDSALHCHECGTELPQDSPVNRRSEPDAHPPLIPIPTATPQPPPEGAWFARDAWKCLGMLFVFEFTLSLIWYAVSVKIHVFRMFTHTGAGHLTYSLAINAVFISTMLYFTRLASLSAASRYLGLTQRPSDYIWFAIVVTLAIRGFSHVLISSGVARGVTTTSLWGFAHGVGIQRYLYLTPALLAPFFEELYMRGFLYRAFRGSYSVVVSTFLILGITALTHWSQIHGSWIAAFGIGGMTWLQCFLRERTGTLWDCIICHFIFNLSAALLMVMHR